MAHFSAFYGIFSEEHFNLSGEYGIRTHLFFLIANQMSTPSRPIPQIFVRTTRFELATYGLEDRHSTNLANSAGRFPFLSFLTQIKKARNKKTAFL